MWELGVAAAGIGVFLYCFVSSIATIVNAYTNIQAVDILQEMQRIHGHSPDDEGRQPYQPD
ncbi:MAG TPA: hypothetical protein VNX68_08500 [Nitrosopumilaceae archaeon]|jgi:hypothetical protein|nr:hypothetical protein [Nitrosopumilaceae archaeon]